MLRKKKTPKLNISEANSTLQNVFEACEIPPNTIPFDKILLRQRANTRFFKTCIFICVAWIAFMLLIPIPFLMIDRQINPPASRAEILILDDYMENDILYMELSTCVNSQKCYLTLPDGSKVNPISYDGLEKLIAFPYYHDEVSIYLESEKNTASATVIITPLG